MKIATIKTGLTSLAMLPGLVMAAPAVADKADNAFMMICTALVLFMTVPGIALFYGGLIRGKNVLSMLTQVTVTFALVCILWVVYGYSLAFGEGNNFFGNINGLMLKNIELTAVMGSIYQYIHVAFQGSFAWHYRRLDSWGAGGTNPLLSCVDFCGGMADALLHSDCAYGLGRRFAGFSRCTGFRGWHGGAH